MALSKDAKFRLEVALADRRAAKEIADALGAVTSPAGHVAPLGATTNLPASNATLSTSDTYTDAAVKAAIDGAVDALRVAAEARLDAAESKIDAILAALQAAGLMS